jgi:hypothetical protein
VRKEHDVLFEKLETRRLMAAQVSITTGGILTIQGNGANEYVGVTQDFENELLYVTVGDDGGNEPTTELLRSSVQGISIDLRGGDNTIDLEVHDLPATLSTGGGTDFISVINHNTEHAVSVSTSNGADFIFVDDTATYGTEVHAGAGSDGITFRQSSREPARPSLGLGGNGNDDLQGPGQYSADDLETLEDETVYVSGLDLGFTWLHGGNGDDRFLAYNVNTTVRGGTSDDDHDAATYYLDSLQPVPALRVEELIILDVVPPVG